MKAAPGAKPLTEQPAACALVADRHELSRHILGSILKGAGYTVQSAPDGEDAWNQIQGGSVDIVITDLDLTGIDGFELCRRLKNSRNTRVIPVIIVTAADDIASRIAAFEHGADDLLPKPVINEELLARVRNLLRLASLIRHKVDSERMRAKLEKELALTHLRQEEERTRSLFIAQVLSAATGGRLQLMDRDIMAPLLEDWSGVEELEVTTPSQLNTVRALTERVAKCAGLVGEGVADAALCVSEAVTNALKFGTQVAFRGGRFEDQIRFVVEDNGPGLKSAILPQITLQKGFSTGISMGMGFSIMLELMDRVGLSTGQTGTTLLLAKSLTPDVGDDIDAFLKRFSVTLD